MQCAATYVGTTYEEDREGGKEGWKESKLFGCFPDFCLPPSFSVPAAAMPALRRRKEGREGGRATSTDEEGRAANNSASPLSADTFCARGKKGGGGGSWLHGRKRVKRHFLLLASGGGPRCSPDSHLLACFFFPCTYLLYERKSCTIFLPLFYSAVRTYT